jgi:hypothetical protein
LAFLSSHTDAQQCFFNRINSETIDRKNATAAMSDGFARRVIFVIAARGVASSA